MAYDAYGRPVRGGGNGEPGYFSDNSMPDYTSSSYYSGSEARDDNPSMRRTGSYRKRASPTIPDRMATAPEQAGPNYDGVSPELIAAITERVKREVMEHIKQTGSVDDQPKSTPMQRVSSNRSNSSSSPPPTARRVYTPPSPTQYSKTTSMPPPPPPMDNRRSPPASPSDKSAGVRFSTRDPAIRPASNRTPSAEFSPVDKKWGKLFNAQGDATPRLGDFLRGLANHLVECFEPQKSIVVTPAKMAAFYSKHTLSREHNHLPTIFRANQYEAISGLYQDLGVEHFLTQETHNSPPVIPSLTPHGFAQWMTLNIMAYPHEEWTRLESIVLAMPINADGCLVDGKPERLPKQISRHLLPDREHAKSKALLDSAIENFLDDLGTDTRRKASITSPPLSRHSSTSAATYQQSSSPPTTKAHPIERERNPYTGAPGSDVSSSDEPIKLERERQPYTAQPGSGKVHNDNLKIPLRPGRSNSTATRPSARDPADDPRHHRTSSTTTPNYQPGMRTGGRRPSSPILKSFSQSTPDDLYMGSKYGANPAKPTFNQPFSPGDSHINSFPPPPGPPPINIRGDARRRDDPYRRATEDFPGEFNSPRDAEKYDRWQDTNQRDGDRFGGGSYDRGAPPVDPRDGRGAPAESWYRENNYDPHPRRY